MRGEERRYFKSDHPFPSVNEYQGCGICLARWPWNRLGVAPKLLPGFRCCRDRARGANVKDDSCLRPRIWLEIDSSAMISTLLRVVGATAFLCASLQAQPSGSFELIGLRGAVRTVTAADLAAMPHRDVSASAHKVSGRYSGVLLPDLLRLVDVPRGDSLRGPALAMYVLIEAADGYRALFAAAEMDAGFTDRIVLLADRKDGAALGAKDGPFQLIVPDEKRPARWVRQVRRIRIVQVSPMSP